jgi:hypothetical protein
MPIPGLVIKAQRGVDRVVVHFDRGDRDGAFALLRRALPALRDLDRRTRMEVEKATK